MNETGALSYKNDGLELLHVTNRKGLDSGRLMLELAPVSNFYPNFYSWLAFTFIQGIDSGARSVIYAIEHGNVVGMALLKKTTHENKICTFYIREEFRNRGYGSALMTASLKALSGKSVIITMSEKRVPLFAALLRQHNFSLSHSVQGLYKDDEQEFFFHT